MTKMNQYSGEPMYPGELPMRDNDGMLNVANVMKNASKGYLAKGGPVVGEKPELTTFDGPGTGTSDSIPAEVPEQGFVITAAAMQMFGPDFFKSLIAAVPSEPASEEAGEQQPVDVKVSDGEGYIPPEVVEFYGADFFEKVNAAASGGEAEGAGESETDPQEMMENDESMGPMVGEEEEDEMKCGGKVKGYAVGGQTKKEEETISPSPITPLVTQNPTGPTVRDAELQQSNINTANNLYANRLSSERNVNPQEIAQQEFLDSVKSKMGNIDATKAPNDFFIGKDTQKAIGETVSNFNMDPGPRMQAATKAFDQYQQENQGASGLSRLVGGIDAGGKAYFNETPQPKWSDPEVQNVLKAEAARENFNSPTFKGDPRNNPPNPINMTVTGMDENKPTVGPKEQPGSNTVSGSVGSTTLAGSGGQEEQTPLQKQAKQPAPSVGDVVNKVSGAATRANREVNQEYPQVGSPDQPMAPDNQKRFPGDDRYYDYSNIKNPNDKTGIPYVNDLGVKDIGNGKFQDVSGEVLFRDPKGVYTNPNTGETSSGYVDRYGRTKWVPRPDEFAPKGTPEQQMAVAGMTPAQREKYGSYIAVRQTSDDPRAQAASQHYIQEMSPVLNLSGKENWNVGTTAADREWMKQHPRKIQPWNTQEDYKNMAYEQGHGGQYEAGIAAQENAKANAKEVEYNNINKKRELDQYEVGKRGRGDNEPGTKYQMNDVSGEIVEVGPQAYQRQEEAKKQKAILNNRYANVQNVLDNEGYFSKSSNPEDRQRLKVAKQVMGTPEFRRWLKEQQNQGIM